MLKKCDLCIKQKPGKLFHFEGLSLCKKHLLLIKLQWGIIKGNKKLKRKSVKQATKRFNRGVK